MKYLGVDYGTKKIGLALSDNDGRVAFPHDIILSDSFAPSVIADLVYKEEAEAIVIGESRDLRGGLNKVADTAQKFAKDLQKFTDVEVHFEDERFSTVQARNVPREGKARGEISRYRAPQARGDGKVDAYAAAIILQSFLDKQSSKS